MAHPSKRDQIVEKAGKLFIAKGFDRVSMDMIATLVPVSKPTLYNHFKDKRALFGAVIAARCGKLLQDIKTEMELHRKKDVTSVMTHVGTAFAELVFSTEAISIHRTLISEARHFPEMARMLEESGPKQIRGLLSGYIKEQHQRGLLYAPDALRATDMFLSTLKGYEHMQCLLGLRLPLTKSQRMKNVTQAVECFMRATRP